MKFYYVSNDWLILHSVGLKAGTIKLYSEKVGQLNSAFGDNLVETIQYTTGIETFEGLDEVNLYQPTWRTHEKYL